ncbi:hypothetical protein JCM11641_006258 [Rhodosporidiobolus odoratus]
MAQRDKEKHQELSPETLQLTHSQSTSKLLTRLTQHSLANLALQWLNETARSANPDDSDEEENFDFGRERLSSRRAIYEQLRDDEVKGAKSRVLKAIQEDWSDGLTYRQVAQLDLQHFQDKGLGRSWTAYQATFASPASARIASSQDLAERFRQAFGAYHTHYLHLSALTSPSPLTILRIQLLPTPGCGTSTHPPPIFLLHLPLTPYLLFPSSLSSSFRSMISHCLSSSISYSPSTPAKSLEELQLKGKDWKGLCEILLKKGCNTGVWRVLREGKREVDGGGVLVPREKRRRVDQEARQELARENDPTQLPPTLSERAATRQKRARREEIEQVFGSTTEALPVLERLDYTVDLPYPSQPPFPTPSQPPILMRFEGTSVLSGLRALVSQGLTEMEAEEGKKKKKGKGPGLVSWLGEAAELGVNGKVRVGRRGDGTVGRV